MTSELKASMVEDREIDDKQYKKINKKEREEMLEYCDKNWSKNYCETMGMDSCAPGYGEHQRTQDMIVPTNTWVLQIQPYVGPTKIAFPFP